MGTLNISEIRRINLRKIAEKHVSGHDRKGYQALTKKIGCHHSYLSQILKDNPTKEIGPGFARKAEKALGLEVYALDTPPWLSNLKDNITDQEKAQDGIIRVAESMLVTSALPVMEIVNGELKTTGQTKNILGMASEKAFVTQAIDKSMEPVINQHQYFAVDPTSPLEDGVICLYWDGGGVVMGKYLGRNGGEIHPANDDRYRPIYLNQVTGGKYLGRIFKRLEQDF
ncbi:S24 family peptidase [Hahella sp. HN01]|uniref:S24 family peptidase n=1 Tax=Hahella sp. HN01 TaxID=2847262 RepID=UPI001C1EB251|nr:S24 family peptidase [Hahella sp. HN01]MBU6954555.1 S24 family peptidase [Hahella sp. HN01]